MLFGCCTLNCVSCYFVSKTWQAAVSSVELYRADGNFSIFALREVRGVLTGCPASSPVVAGNLLQKCLDKQP